MSLNIIDISTYNTITNWSSVAKNVDMAIIKATQGHSLYNAKLKNFTDSKFVSHITNAIKHDIPVACYHFLTASTLNDAITEADQFDRAMRPYKKYILYAICDAENYNNKYLLGLNKKELSNVISTFCHRLEELGYKTIVYTNPDHIKNYIDIRLINRPLWIADYASSKKPQYNANIFAWQYTSKGKIDGISGPVDLSYGYIDINTNKSNKNNSINNTSDKADNSSDNIIKVGDTVRVINTSNNNGKIYSITYAGAKWRVYYDEYVVSQIIRDRAVIEYKNVVAAAVNISNLEKVL